MAARPKPKTKAKPPEPQEYVASPLTEVLEMTHAELKKAGDRYRKERARQFAESEREEIKRHARMCCDEVNIETDVGAMVVWREEHPGFDPHEQNLSN